MGADAGVRLLQAPNTAVMPSKTILILVKFFILFSTNSGNLSRLNVSKSFFYVAHDKVAYKIGVNN